MKRLLMIMAMVAMLVFASQLYAAPVTLVDQGAGSTWYYNNVGPTANYYQNFYSITYANSTDWNDPAYGSWDWNDATTSWNSGATPFGNTGNPAADPNFTSNSSWDQDTVMALSLSFDLTTWDFNNMSDIALTVASDNAFKLYINENEVASGISPGFTSYWEYNYALSLGSSYLQAGTNKIEVLAIDDAQIIPVESTFFDMQLTANVNPIPVPTTIILFVTGLAALVGIKRRAA